MVRVVPFLMALLFAFLPLLLAHQVGKMPEDPWLGSLPDMFGNLAFVVALGLGLPYPAFMAAVFLALSAWVGYRLGRRWAG